MRTLKPILSFLLVSRPLPSTADASPQPPRPSDSYDAAAGGVDSSSPPRGGRRPNVVILLADNLAYDDVGAFAASSGGGTSATPNVDSLASRGLRLLDWISPAALCSASRAALLTGRYPVRTGAYPRVFEPDAAAGLPPDEVTLAEYLREEGYATKIVGKWHLGHRPGYLPTDQGFDSWLGVPYHMSGGSVDGHVCGSDPNRTDWLPLFRDATIVEQPVRLEDLALRYAESAVEFVEENAAAGRPFFLYLPFSHVHQLCAPRHAECQWASSRFSRDGRGYRSDFDGAVREMDWIAGRVLGSLRDSGVEDDTLVLFTSDNGPWVAEGSCSGSKGRFEGRWLRDNVDPGCTACPGGYVPAPLPGRPRRCVYPPPPSSGDGGDDAPYETEGVHCGEDSGLGSAWEANVRVPAIARWPRGGIPEGAETNASVATLDVLPTVLSILGRETPENVDGIDVSDVLRGGGAKRSAAPDDDDDDDDGAASRAIFFWRDGFRDGPLPPPYGRFDVAAVRIGSVKAWIWTKSAHYNSDPEVYHDPPLLFDVLSDPAESVPLDPEERAGTVRRVRELVREHKAGVDWRGPLTLARDPRFLPCADRDAGCRTPMGPSGREDLPKAVK